MKFAVPRARPSPAARRAPGGPAHDRIGQSGSPRVTVLIRACHGTVGLGPGHPAGPLSDHRSDRTVPGPPAGHCGQPGSHRRAVVTVATLNRELQCNPIMALRHSMGRVHGHGTQFRVRNLVRPIRTA
eukprot:478008-Hanusia_phi.AAC.1